MAEQVKRRIDQILCDMFQGNKSAIEKYAKVRYVQWEISLWRRYGLPLHEVKGDARMYFQRRFLKEVDEDATLKTATEVQIAEAFKRLDHAVKDGCHGRCMRLVVELNQALDELGLEVVNNPEQFLDWLTFNYTTEIDDWGNPAKEKPFGFELRQFHDAENRKEFWAELLPMLKVNKVVSMQDIVRIMLFKRARKSVNF